MKESVIYQDIVERGIREGLQQGLQQGELNMVLRLLDRRVGKIDKKTTKKLNSFQCGSLERWAKHYWISKSVTI